MVQLAVTIVSTLLVASGPDSSASTKKECARTFELGQVSRRAGRLLEARQALIRCTQACPDVVKDQCARWLEELEPLIPSMVIVVRDDKGKDVAYAAIAVDQADVAASSFGQAIELDPGPHSISVTDARGSLLVREEVVVIAGEKARRIELAVATAPVIDAPTIAVAPSPPPPAIVLSEEPPAPGSTASGPSLLTYLLGGTTLAAAGGSVGFGLVSHFERADLLQNCARPCPESRLEPVHRNQIISDVFLATAVVALGLGVWSLVDDL
jgi:hypothetical protein